MTPPDAGRICANCGSPITSETARFCEHCGASLEELASPPAPEPFGDVTARFRALAGHPEFADLSRRMPAVPELSGSTFLSVLALLGFGVAGVLVSLVFFSFCPPLGIVPLALVAFGGYVLGRRLLWTVRTPLEAHGALVRNMRSKVQLGAEHSPSNAQSFVTLELADGRRVELECFPSAADGLSVGTMGVAYLKGTRLASFVRVAV